MDKRMLFSMHDAWMWCCLIYQPVVIMSHEMIAMSLFDPEAWLSLYIRAKARLQQLLRKNPNPNVHPRQDIFSYNVFIG